MDLATRILLLLSFASVAGIVHVVARPRPGRLFLRRLSPTPRHVVLSRRVLRVNAMSLALAVIVLLAAPDPHAPLFAAALAAAFLAPLGCLVVGLIAAARASSPPGQVSRFVVPLDLARDSMVPSASTVIGRNAVVLLLPAVAMLLANAGDFGPWRFFAPVLVLLNGLVTLARWLQVRERAVLPIANAARYAELSSERRLRIVQLLETARLAWNTTGGLIWACTAFGTTGPAGVVAIAAIAVGGPGVVLIFARALPRLTAIADELSVLAGVQALGTRRDGWRWGGLLYFAPHDPALAVPRISGLGQTLNFARPAAWGVVLLALLAPPLLTLLALS